MVEKRLISLSKPICYFWQLQNTLPTIEIIATSAAARILCIAKRSFLPVLNKPSTKQLQCLATMQKS